MLNQTVLIGNLGADPEIKYLQNGDPIANLNLAFKSGKEKTSWIRLTAFKRLAEVCEKYLHKGDRIAVSGTLDQERWETDGQTRTSFKVIIHTVEFINVKGHEGENGSDIPF